MFRIFRRYIIMGVGATALCAGLLGLVVDSSPAIGSSLPSCTTSGLMAQVPAGFYTDPSLTTLSAGGGSTVFAARFFSVPGNGSISLENLTGVLGTVPSTDYPPTCVAVQGATSSFSMQPASGAPSSVVTLSGPVPGGWRVFEGRRPAGWPAPPLEQTLPMRLMLSAELSSVSGYVDTYASISGETWTAAFTVQAIAQPGIYYVLPTIPFPGVGGGQPTASTGSTPASSPPVSTPVSTGKGEPKPPPARSVGTSPLGAAPPYRYTVSRLFSSLSHDAGNLGLAAGGLLFVSFPSQLFNHTLEDNYEAIVEWRRRIVRAFRNRYVVRRSARRDLPERVGKASIGFENLAAPESSRIGVSAPIRWVGLGGVFTVGVALDAFLDQAPLSSERFWLNLAAVAAALLILIVLPGFALVAYRRKRGLGARFQVKAFPMGLAIAAACVVVSRFSHFEPGYLYGFIIAVYFAEVDTKAGGHAAVIGVETTALVALLAWIVWWPLLGAGAAIHGSVGYFIADLCYNVFIAGIVAATFSAIPLHFFPGQRIWEWNRWWWGAVELANLGLLFTVLVNPHLGAESSRSWAATVILFVLFAAISVGMWAFFRFKKSTGDVAENLQEDDTALPTIE